MAIETTMIETGHQLIQREPDGEIYCSRCGLYSPSDEEPCTPIYLVVSDSSTNLMHYGR